MEAEVITSFRFAYGGYNVQEIAAGRILRDDDEAWQVAIEEGYIARPPLPAAAAAATETELTDPAWPPVPRLWPGEIVACVASGPSLTQADVDQLRGRCKVIVVNDNYRLAPWADLLYAADEKWWDHHHGVPEFAGIKVTWSVPAAKRWNLKRVPGVRQPGLSCDPARLHLGGNSGYQAINLAWLMGARRIVLLGYDMQAAPGKTHWFGDHPKPLQNNGTFKRWIANMATIRPTLHGVEVINCSRATALECFPRADLDLALEGAQS